MTPLRQFRGVPADVIRKAEGKQFVSPLRCLFLDLKLTATAISSHGIDTSTW